MNQNYQKEKITAIIEKSANYYTKRRLISIDSIFPVGKYMDFLPGNLLLNNKQFVMIDLDDYRRVKLISKEIVSDLDLFDFYKNMFLKCYHDNDDDYEHEVIKPVWWDKLQAICT